jgi:hypothetical protein
MAFPRGPPHIPEEVVHEQPGSFRGRKDPWGRLRHPIIDADGHWLEFWPVMHEEFPRIGGDAAVEALAMASQRVPNSLAMSLAERTRRRIGQEAFWSSPSENVRDRARAMLPRLMYERLVVDKQAQEVLARA